MAKLVVCDDQEFEKLRQIVSGPMVVVIKQSIAVTIGEEKLDELAEDYDCGGDPDSWVDFVGTNDHYFLTDLREEGSL